MNAEAAVEALKAIHIECERYYDNGYSGNTGLPCYVRGCRQCGDGWPCETRRILDLVEA